MIGNLNKRLDKLERKMQEKKQKGGDRMAKEVNQDEMIGFILRLTGRKLTYEEVADVLDWERRFLEEKSEKKTSK